MSLQDRFLNGARKAKAPLTIFLVKGVKLQGVITGFDAFSLLLRRDGQTQLIYKHSISTIMPGRPIEIDEDEQADGSQAANLQDRFLSAAERERQHMSIFLVNGIMLQGTVSRHDQFCLILERISQTQLIYKHAISTMQPDHPLDLAAEE